MTSAQIMATLNSNDTSALVDLNDWAVNTVREYCREAGCTTLALATEEAARLTGSTWESYKRASRVGAHIRLNRKVRLAVWTAAATREALGL